MSRVRMFKTSLSQLQESNLCFLLRRGIFNRNGPFVVVGGIKQQKLQSIVAKERNNYVLSYAFEVKTVIMVGKSISVASLSSLPDAILLLLFLLALLVLLILARQQPLEKLLDLLPLLVAEDEAYPASGCQCLYDLIHESLVGKSKNEHIASTVQPSNTRLFSLLFRQNLQPHHWEL